MRWLAALSVICGCGRIDFDALPSIGDAPADASTEVPFDAFAIDRCMVPTTAPASIMVSGRTVQAADFGAVLIPEPDVQLTIRNGNNGALFGTTTSDSGGNYAISVSLGGSPREVTVLADKPGWISTLVQPGYVVAEDLVVDVPLTDIGGLGAIYGTGGVTRDVARGTVLIEIRDCTERRVPGAQVVVTPAPEAVVYTDEQGVPAPTLPKASTHSAAVALNTDPVLTMFQATKSGLTYAARTLTIAPGDLITIVQLVPMQ